MPVETPSDRRAFRGSALVALALLVAFVAWVTLEDGRAGLVAVLTHAGLSLALVGKFIVFGGLHDDTVLSVWQLAAMVFLLDLLFGFALAGGLRALEHAPLLGGRLLKARTRALELINDYPGLQRRAFFGVMLFVFLPLAGTGAITGSFLARIFGLSRFQGVTAIACGSAVTSLTFAFLARFVGDRAETILKNPALTGLSVVVLLLVCWRAYAALLSRMKA